VVGSRSDKLFRFGGRGDSGRRDSGFFVLGRHWNDGSRSDRILCLNGFLTTGCWDSKLVVLC
jgi:hypothetical protein